MEDLLNFRSQGTLVGSGVPGVFAPLLLHPEVLTASEKPLYAFPPQIKLME
jgi:hypothetical protein